MARAMNPDPATSRDSGGLIFAASPPPKARYWRAQRMARGSYSSALKRIASQRNGALHVPRPIAFMLMVFLSVGAACGSPPTSPGGTDSITGGAQGDKLLHVSIQAQPTTFIASVTGGVTAAGGRIQVTALAHDWLTFTEVDGTPRPSLATELPSLDRGTWVLNADGSMVTTWQLRPGVTWQDGAPFTADDLVFGWQLVTAPNSPAQGSAEARAAGTVEALDPLTLRITWRSVLPSADALGPGTIEPLPRRLLAGALQDPSLLLGNPYFNGQFIGLGPFRVVHWVEGSYMQLMRYEGFYRGVPPLSRIDVQFMGDPNSQVSAILAGQLDVILPQGVDIGTTAVVRQRWEGTGNQIIAAPDNRVEYVAFQLRPGDQTQPALLDAGVRHALGLAINRQELVDIVTAGQAAIAATLVPPWLADQAAISDDIPPARYDPAAAIQALEDLGWHRSSDGALRTPGGEPLAFAVNTAPAAHSESERVLVANDWMQLGVQVDTQLQSSAAIRDPETLARFPGAQVSASLYQLLWTTRFQSGEIAGPNNHW